MNRAAILVVIGMAAIALFSGCGVSQSEYQNCINEKDTINRRFNELNSEYLETSQKMTGMISEMEKDHEALVAELDNQKKQLEELQAAHKSDQDKLRETVKQFVESQAKVNKMEEDAVKYRNIVAQTGELMAKLQKELDEVKAENEKLKAQTPAKVE